VPRSAPGLARTLSAAATQIFAVVMRAVSRLERPECSARRQCSTHIRYFREWKRVKSSLLRSEHDAHLVTGDFAMLSPIKLGLATTVAALLIAAVTSAGAAVDPTSADSASAGSAPARPTFEMQAQARSKCYEDLGYGRTGLFGCGG